MEEESGRITVDAGGDALANDDVDDIFKLIEVEIKRIEKSDC